MFNQCSKSKDRKLAGIEIEVQDAEMAGVCRGCTNEILGHECAHTINMTAKYLDLSFMPHDEICEKCIRGKQHQKTTQKR